MVFTTQSKAYDCHFDKLKPGATKKALEEINIFAYGPDTSDIFTKQLYVEENTRKLTRYSELRFYLSGATQEILNT